MKLFNLTADTAFGAGLGECLGVEPSSFEARTFEDAEFKIRPLESVRKESVLIYQSLAAEAGFSTNDKLLRLLFFIGALKDSGAAQITAIVPYLTYQRKDRRTKHRDPISTRYLAQLFEAVGLDTIVTVDVHNPAAFENAFRCCKEHVEAAPLFVEHFLATVAEADKTVIVSPDIGGAKRARKFAALLGERAEQPIGLAFLEKERSQDVVSGKLFAGDVAGATAIVIDDMICGGTTLLRAVSACKARGARSIRLAATHALFSEAAHRLAAADVESIVVTDTVPNAVARCPGLAPKLVVLPIAASVGAVVRRLAD